MHINIPALSGADAVGNFNQLDKATCLKIFMKSGSDIIGALKQLLVASNETSERQMTMLASFFVMLTAQTALGSANKWQRVPGFHQRQNPQTAHSTRTCPS